MICHTTQFVNVRWYHLKKGVQTLFYTAVPEEGDSRFQQTAHSSDMQSLKAFDISMADEGLYYCEIQYTEERVKSSLEYLHVIPGKTKLLKV